MARLFKETIGGREPGGVVPDAGDLGDPIAVTGGEQAAKTYEQAIAHLRCELVGQAISPLVAYETRSMDDVYRENVRAVSFCAFVYGRDYDTVRRDLIGGE